MLINNCNSSVIISKEDSAHGPKNDDHDATKIIATLNYAGNNGLTPPVMKEGNIQSTKCVEMVCGFADSRNLDAKEGVKMFTVDHLNYALRISYEKFDGKIVQDIQRGIIIDHSMVDKFNTSTRIDLTLSRQLLQSWSLYLRDHYDFISIKKALLKRAAKCITPCGGCFEYLLSKNNAHKLKLSSSLKQAFRQVFTAIMENEDVSGLKILENFRPQKKIKLFSILKIIFFRRTSKLALKWCNEQRLSVNFDADFEHDAAMEAIPSGYRPITFSEYKFSKKKNFNNVFIRSLYNVYHETSPSTRRALTQNG